MLSPPSKDGRTTLFFVSLQITKLATLPVSTRDITTALTDQLLRRRFLATFGISNVLWLSFISLSNCVKFNAAIIKLVAYSLQDMVINPSFVGCWLFLSIDMFSRGHCFLNVSTLTHR